MASKPKDRGPRQIGGGSETGAGEASGTHDNAADTGDAAVVLPVEDFLDLHPFRPRDIPSVVESYLEAALEAGFREVRLIHGRGMGVQRQRVRSLLGRHPLVQDFTDAPPVRGGWGATLVRLRPAPGSD